MNTIWNPHDTEGVEPFENKFDTWKEVIHYFWDVENALDVVGYENDLYEPLGVAAGDYYIQLYGRQSNRMRDNPKGHKDIVSYQRWWIAYKYRDPDWESEIQEGYSEDMYYCELTTSLEGKTSPYLGKPPILKDLGWGRARSKNYWGFGSFYKIDIDYDIKGFKLINWINRNPMEVKE